MIKNFYYGTLYFYKKNIKSIVKQANGAPLSLIVIKDIHNEIIKKMLNLTLLICFKFSISINRKKIIKVITLTLDLVMVMIICKY